jgi:hypothetical protein
VEKAAYEVVIKSNKGIAIKDPTKVVLTATLYFGGKEYKGKDVSYKWYNLNDRNTILSTN